MKRLFYRCTMALAILTVLLLLFAAPAIRPVPERKPSSPAKDYLVCEATNQIATAYTELANAPPSASGRPYFIGAVAVHPKIPGGSHLDPIIPFGTVIHLTEPKTITVQGQKLNSFTVIDTGDANWRLWGESPYWIDIYFGTGGYWANKEALAYGKRRVSYYWLEEFK